MQKLVDQFRQHNSAQCALMERDAAHVIFANSREVNDHLSGFGVTENVPWVAFIGEPVLALNGTPARRQHSCGTIQILQFVPGPATLTETVMG